MNTNENVTIICAATGIIQIIHITPTIPTPAKNTSIFVRSLVGIVIVSLSQIREGFLILLSFRQNYHRS